MLSDVASCFWLVFFAKKQLRGNPSLLHVVACLASNITSECEFCNAWSAGVSVVAGAGGLVSIARSSSDRKWLGVQLACCQTMDPPFRDPRKKSEHRIQQEGGPLLFRLKGNPQEQDHISFPGLTRLVTPSFGWCL